MHERTLEVRTADGIMPTFVTRPEEGGPFPAVILFMDALGIREELRDMARRIAHGRLLRQRSRACSTATAVPASTRRTSPTRRPDPQMLRLNRELTHARCLADTEALLDTLAARPRRPRSGRHHRLLHGRPPCRRRRRRLSRARSRRWPRCTVASRSPTGPTPPISRLGSVKAECYFGFADDDPLTPPEHQRVLAEACREHGVLARFEVHPGTQHGFTFPTRHCYDKPAAERVWERIFAMLGRRLSPRR